MNFAEVFTKDFLFTWQGRINRQRYWAFFLVYIAIAVIGEILDGITGGKVFSVVIALALIYPSICVGIKRWHDRDKSGWWTLINLIPIVGWIWSLVEQGFLVGTAGPNRFGEDPLGQPSLPPPAA